MERSPTPRPEAPRFRRRQYGRCGVPSAKARRESLAIAPALGSRRAIRSGVGAALGRRAESLLPRRQCDRHAGGRTDASLSAHRVERGSLSGVEWRTRAARPPRLVADAPGARPPPNAKAD